MLYSLQQFGLSGFLLGLAYYCCLLFINGYVNSVAITGNIMCPIRPISNVHLHLYLHSHLHPTTLS